jgi:uncharacterized protein (TIGR04255 family)
VKYTNPPVVETVLSVQFNPLANFGAGLLGAYWKRLGTKWSNVTDAPAVDPVYERFESASVWDPTAIGLKLSQKVELRLQIRNQAKDRMIQVQNGRFFYNWLGTPGATYPSYESVRPEFDESWEEFREFVISASDENSVQPNQWEIIYVNHMHSGTVWNDLSELPDVLKFLRKPNLGESNLLADGIGGEWRFEITPKRGRLYVRLGMAKQEEGVPCVVMTLVARGPVDDEEMTLHNGLELGHETIVDAFDLFTSGNAKKYWGMQNAYD